MRSTLLMTIGVAACAHGAGSSTATAPSTAQTAPVNAISEPEPVPHADYAALRPFRNYYRILSVSPYLEHYRAYYVDAELVRAYYTAVPNAAAVAFGGSDFGLAEGTFLDAVPAEHAATARAIRDDVAKTTKQRTEAVVYLGTYREVVVEEIVPHDEPGDPAHRSAAFRTLTLGVDESMTHITEPGSKPDMGGGDGRLCWRPVRDCGPAPYWFDARADREGVVRLWRLEDRSSDVPPAARTAFEDAVLAAATHVVAGAPPPPLRDLGVQQGDVLLPDDLDDTISLGLDVSLIPSPRPGLPSPSALESYVTIPLSLGRALAADGTRGTVGYFFAGRELSLTASLVATAPATTTGRSTLALALEYWLRDGTHPIKHGTARLLAPVLVDGPRVMPIASPLPATADPTDLPFHERLPTDNGLEGALEIGVQLHGGP